MREISGRHLIQAFCICVCFPEVIIFYTAFARVWISDNCSCSLDRLIANQYLYRLFFIVGFHLHCSLILEINVQLRFKLKKVKRFSGNRNAGPAQFIHVGGDFRQQVLHIHLR